MLPGALPRFLCLFLLLRFKSVLSAYQTQPHIIVFLVDDLGWNDVGFHGSDQIPTPNIDALGYNGVILNRHYTLPSSTSARTAFYTGLYPIRMGMQGDGIRGGEPRGIPLNVRILPEYLQQLGYKTNLIGKWHVGFHTRAHTPPYRGFHSFLGFYNSHVSYYDYEYTDRNMSGYDMHCGDEPAYGLSHEYATDFFTREAVKVIERHKGESDREIEGKKKMDAGRILRPMYLQISHLAVHAPLEGPHSWSTSENFSHIPEPNRRKYARMVSRLDESVGHVVHALGENHMLKDSIILFLTDNGAMSIGKSTNWGSNYPLRGTKRTLFEGGVRGVAVLWSQRLKRSAYVANQLVHVSDWLPTFYSAAGGNLTDLGEIDGRDQWRDLGEGKGYVRDRLLLNIDEVQKTEAAIRGRFKLLRGSIENGYYDGYFGDSGRTREMVETYAELILKSTVSDSIRQHLGGPVTPLSMISGLRQNATVDCPNVTNRGRRRYTTCNITECLFDVVNDPCETTNLAKEYPRITQDLNRLLEDYGRVLVRQKRPYVDWMADPRTKNDTWEPWLNPGTIFYTNTTASIGAVVYLVHIGLVLFYIALSAF